MTHCPHSTPFNISATAGFYSIVAGVMAGFAFISLSYFITAPHRAGDGQGEQRDKYNLAVQALGAAFVALLLSCIAYAVMAGEHLPGGRASTIEVFAGCGFALAAIQLFYAIVLIIQAHHPEILPIQRFFESVGGFLCLLAYVLIAEGVSDYQEARDDRAGNIVYWWGWSLLFILLVSLICAWRSRTRYRIEMPALRNPAYFTMGMAAVGITATSVGAATLGECQTASPFLMVLILALTCGALANQIVWFFQPPTVFRQPMLRRRRADAAP